MKQRTVMTLLALSLLLTVCMMKKPTLTPKASTINLTIAVVGTAPFLDPSLSYEDSISVPNPTFAAGMLYDDIQETTWLFGEGIERPNRSEQLQIYHSIFQTIEQSRLVK